MFKTIDGGKTWTKLTEGLPNDPQTGAIDMVMDPTNPEVLYVTFWQRIRYPWALKSGGPNSGIYKIDQRRQVVDEDRHEGHAATGDLGRIGIAISRTNPKVLMAHVEHGYQPNCGGGRGGGGGAAVPAIQQRRGGGRRRQAAARRAARDGAAAAATPPPNPDCAMTKLGAGMYRSEDGGAIVDVPRSRDQPAVLLHARRDQPGR